MAGVIFKALEDKLGGINLKGHVCQGDLNKSGYTTTRSSVRLGGEWRARPLTARVVKRSFGLVPLISW